MKESIKTHDWHQDMEDSKSTKFPYNSNELQSCRGERKEWCLPDREEEVEKLSAEPMRELEDDENEDGV